MYKWIHNKVPYYLCGKKVFITFYILYFETVNANKMNKASYNVYTEIRYVVSVTDSKFNIERHANIDR